MPHRHRKTSTTRQSPRVVWRLTASRRPARLLPQPRHSSGSWGGRHGGELVRPLKGLPSEYEPIPEDPEEKRLAILKAVEAGEPVVSVAKRFGVADRTVRRYRENEREQKQSEPFVGPMVDPALLGEDA